MANEIKTITDPMTSNNPVTVQVLGICSALAVTSQLQPSLVMGLAVMFVVAGSNVIVSLIRKQIPNRVRMIVEMVVIASMVIFVDLFLKAFAWDVSKQLSVFVGLIITNCIVLGRLEAYAMGNKVWPSFLDGIGNGIGYAAVLVIVGATRELFGSGSLWNVKLIPESWYTANGGFYDNNGLMVLAPAAFILLGLIVWIQRTLSGYEED
ncbi:NADH:ubiquinone reductase (Na(+)-transporting) subunit D [bacterium M21]|nr:NADH:ubiquinone reductase (Na(+)-transporting) subunit D [bacterium M21]